jgi:hypothetical protein
MASFRSRECNVIITFHRETRNSRFNVTQPLHSARAPLPIPFHPLGAGRASANPYGIIGHCPRICDLPSKPNGRRTDAGPPLRRTQNNSAWLVQAPTLRCALERLNRWVGKLVCDADGAILASLVLGPRRRPRRLSWPAVIKTHPSRCRTAA